MMWWVELRRVLCGSVYGDADPSPLTTGSGTFLGADSVTATYSRASGERRVGEACNIPGTPNHSEALTNYTITNTGGSFTITPKAATWTTDANSKTYGDAD